MQSDHHLARMGTEQHPVPRFEIVHKPRRCIDVHDSDSGMTSSGEGENPQPWSARFIGGNGEEVWRTAEPYVDVRDAEHAIDLLVEALGSQALFAGVKVKKDTPRPEPIAIVRVEVGP